MTLITRSGKTSALQVRTASDREIAITRIFEAPRALVFDAWTSPALVKRWLLGPSGWSMPICEIDLQIGGRYRFVWRRDADGKEMAMGGVYRDVVTPERIVATERFDDAWYPGEAVVTTIFVEMGGGTTVTSTMLFESREVRDGVLKSPMESGVTQSYDRLAALLPSLQAPTGESDAA